MVRIKTLKHPVSELRKFVFFLLVSLFTLMTASVNASSGLPDFTGLVKEASPSVVNISTSTQPGKATRGPLSEEELQQIPEFFRHFFGAPNGRGQSPQPSHSMGSGFIVSEDGYILTNNHVIADADEIIVRLSDRRELPAELIGSDERSDLALLKVKANNLPVVKVGKSRELNVGEWVLAIGSPFGFEYTVTAGIVSALGRSLPNENYVPFIQTDVAINPGNSGGPLFNLEGEVVGINSQIYTRSGGFMGVSFAIPIDVAMEVTEQIKSKGFVSRGWLGVLIQEVNRDLAESFGLKKPKGALVAQVMADSPAAEAGLLAGDIIIAYEGQEISMSSDLPHLVGRTKVGEKAELTIIREGQEKSVKVKIGELPDAEGKPAQRAEQKTKDSDRLGLMVKPLTDKEASALGVDGGIRVIGVEAGAAQEAGVRQGDVITSINHQPIESLTDFQKIVESLPVNKAVAVRLIRDGNPMFVVIKIKE